MPKAKSLLLVVLDGWGLRAEREANAIALAGTPNIDSLTAEFPWTALEVSGPFAGLPAGKRSHSEIGHKMLGAGRMICHDLLRINRAIEDGSFFCNPALLAACQKVKGSGGALHLVGLLSDAGIHSYIGHLYACLELARRQGIAETYVHAFLGDGNTPPQTGAAHVEELEEWMRRAGYGRVASVTGRAYAMDREENWNRTSLSYATLVRGEGFRNTTGLEAVRSAYAHGESDDLMMPVVIVADSGQPIGCVKDGDAVVFFNLRADRARQMTRAVAAHDFREFDRGPAPRLSAFVSMTEHDGAMDLPVAFPPDRSHEGFPEIVSRAGLRQLRCAETEKGIHVTSFFNGGHDAPFPGEDRILVPPPRGVTSYDENPEMSCAELTDQLVQAVEAGQHEFILANFANPDMAGHTGSLDAAIRAVRAVDECVGRVWKAARNRNMAMIVTSDHGNCEMMVDPVTGGPHTGHTQSPVPFILADPDFRGVELREGGGLADVAPTALRVMGLDQPEAMTGSVLVLR